MGYHVSRGVLPGPSIEWLPTLTAGEYRRAFASTCTLAATLCSPMARLGRAAPESWRSSDLVRAGARLSRSQGCAMAWSAVGLVCLTSGRLPAAVRYLEHALDLLSRPRRRQVSLDEALATSFEAMRVRLALKLIYSRLGIHEAVRRVARDDVGR